MDRRRLGGRRLHPVVAPGRGRVVDRAPVRHVRTAPAAQVAAATGCAGAGDGVAACSRTAAGRCARHARHGRLVAAGGVAAGGAAGAHAGGLHRSAACARAGPCPAPRLPGQPAAGRGRGAAVLPPGRVVAVAPDPRGTRTGGRPARGRGHRRTAQAGARAGRTRRPPCGAARRSAARIGRPDARGRATHVPHRTTRPSRPRPQWRQVAVPAAGPGGSRAGLLCPCATRGACPGRRGRRRTGRASRSGCSTRGIRDRTAGAGRRIAAGGGPGTCASRGSVTTHGSTAAAGTAGTRDACAAAAGARIGAGE